MSPWLLPLLIGAAAPPFTDVGPEPYSSADYSGSLERAPITHWVQRLPGVPASAATNSELGRPLIVGDLLYVGTAGADELFMLRRDDGSVAGSLPAGAPVMSEPVLAGELLVFADGAGYTWCYDLDGVQRWRHYAGAPVLSSPVVVDQTVYVSALDGTLHALSLDEGQSRWLYKHPGDRSRESELELYGAPAPVAAGPLILAGFHDGSLVALEQVSGEVSWKVRVGEGRYPDLIGEPLASGSDVFAGGFSAPFQAVDVGTQNVRWSLDFGIASSPIVSERTLYVPGSDGKLRAIDTVNGGIVWEWDSDTSGALTEPQITAAGLLVASSDGGLWLVDPGTGQTSWTYDDGFMINGVSVAPVVDGRQVILITNAGNILSLLVPATPQVSPEHAEPPWIAPFGSERGAGTR
jgi:outer membrane protein assembly factor BamB